MVQVIKPLQDTLENVKVYSTRYDTQAVTHPGTDWARRCLTSGVGREPVLSTLYGRRHSLPFIQRPPGTGSGPISRPTATRNHKVTDFL